VTTKPPAMLTEEMRTAKEARAWGKDEGKKPPPMIRRPPTAVIPEIAFVIDIRGVWRAGATPQTEKYPVITEREKMLAIVRIAGFVQENPNPKIESNPPDNPRAFFKDFWKRFSGTAEAAAAAL